VGTIGWLATAEERQRAFLLGNALISVPVLGTAVVGAVAVDRIDPARLDYRESLRKGLLLERLLGLGIALDVAAAGAGWALWEHGLRVDSRRLVGFGQALVVQGAALLLFDLGVLAANRSYDRRLLELLPTTNGVAVGLRF